MRPISRRSFLAASAGLVVLAACGGDNGDDAGGTDGTDGTEGAIATMLRFGPDALGVAGERYRLVAGLADQDKVLLTDVPAELPFRITTLEGTDLQGPFAVTRHGRGVPRPYYPFTVTLPEPGTYVFATEVDGQTLRVPFTVVDNRSVAPIPRPGQPLPPLDTPTTADPRGVNPICTRDPACPFHEVTLAEALAEGRPVAFLVGTPAHCQTGVCGPILDLLIDAAGRFDGVRFVHAEPYTDDTLTTTTPAVTEYGLFFEPVLFLAAADGTITDRFDYIVDADEIDQALARLR